MNALTGYLRCAVRPMTSEESEIKWRIIIAKKPGQSSIVDEELHAKLLGTDTYACIYGRMAWAGAAERVSRDCLLFAASITGIPGALVMWALTFALIAEVHGRCTFDDFIQAFPMGLPTDDAMRLAWDAQKHAQNRNRVDQLDQWPKAREAVQS